jgi:hypothetical protein
LLQPGLGLTVYFEDGLPWAETGAAELFDRFLEVVPPYRFKRWTTSTFDDWRDVHLALPEIRTQLSIRNITGRVRHLWSFRIGERPDAPEVELAYREVARGPMSPLGYVELQMPIDVDPAELLALTIEVGQRFPVTFAIGGYRVSWNRHYPRNAHHWFWRFARRFLGFDMQNPERAAWRAAQWLPGSSWLTLIGSTEALDEDARATLKARTWERDIAVIPLAAGLLLRAGEHPQIGDVNQMEFPFAQAEVARALHPFFDPSPPGPDGVVEEEDLQRDWRDRLVSLEEW